MGSILIADDDKTCRDSIQKVLEREGHTVQTAESVDRALETLGSNHFDLVVCDYRMPGKTGIDLLIELRRKESTVPVLMISAFADAMVEAAVKRLGALDVLKKPIRRQELVDEEPAELFDPTDRWQMQAIGIEKGEPFAPDEDKALLSEAARIGGAIASDEGVRAALAAGLEFIVADPVLPPLLAAVRSRRDATGSPGWRS